MAAQEEQKKRQANIAPETAMTTLKPFDELLQEKVDKEGWDAFAWFRYEMGSGEKSQVVAPPTTRRRPELNSKLLKSEAGTVWIVIGGVAYGYTSDDIFRQVQYRCYLTDPYGPTHAQGRVCPRFHRWEDYSDIKTRIMDPLCSLRVSPINRAVYLIRSGVRHGITSARAFDNYQFDWDDVKEWDVSVELWNRLEEGVLLTEETGGRYD